MKLCQMRLSPRYHGREGLRGCAKALGAAGVVAPVAGPMAQPQILPSIQADAAVRHGGLPGLRHRPGAPEVTPGYYGMIKSDTAATA